MTRVFAAGSCAEATTLLTAHRPTICILDSDAETEDLKNLLNLFEELHPEMKRVSLLLNSVGSKKLYSDGQTDGHLDKPFVTTDLRKALLKTMTAKFYPDSFMRKVLNGDQLAKEDQVEKARAEYLAACVMNPNALRAHRGLAFLELKAGRKNEALPFFKKARECGSLDIKSFSAEFETLVSLQNFEAASKIIPLLCAASPQTSNSLKRLFEVALLAQNFADQEVLVGCYNDLQVRSPELDSTMQSYLSQAASQALQNPK